MKKYSLSHIGLGIEIHNLKNMVKENNVYDWEGNSVKDKMEAEIERLQKIYDDEEINEDVKI